ncbi:PE domain-containing protein [Pseudonocardia sp. ICBG1293]|uniref:PE domain-containing protein n=1 Tax=Pseudonocardia sp. ICBG1293 TaxID=2844382 RepID=UPI001CC9ACEF|nr:PE domain-containing protein [Pseudonocardia sp. ICBG1293]
MSIGPSETSSTVDPALLSVDPALLSQISPTTVLQVGEALNRQIDDMRSALIGARTRRVDRCGADPISDLATPAFDRKFQQILETHAAHQDELEQVVRALRAVAESYQLNESDIERTFGAKESGET